MIHFTNATVLRFFDHFRQDAIAKKTKTTDTTPSSNQPSNGMRSGTKSIGDTSYRRAVNKDSSALQGALGGEGKGLSTSGLTTPKGVRIQRLGPAP